MVNVQRVGFLDWLRKHDSVEVGLVRFGDGWQIRGDLAGDNVGLAAQRSGAGARVFKTLDAAYRELSGLLAEADQCQAVVRVYG